MEYDIHIECAACDCGMTETQVGGVDANGPWAEYRESKCHECDGSGIVYVGREVYDSLADLKADYPESFAKNLATGEWR